MLEYEELQPATLEILERVYETCAPRAASLGIEPNIARKLFKLTSTAILDANFGGNEEAFRTHTKQALQPPSSPANV